MANNGTQTRMQHGVKAQFRNNKNKNTPEFDHAIQWRKKNKLKIIYRELCGERFHGF